MIPQPIAFSSDAGGESNPDHEDVTKRSEHQLHAVQKPAPEHTADVGESDKTPLILISEVWVFAAIAVFAVLAVADRVPPGFLNWPYGSSTSFGRRSRPGPSKTKAVAEDVRLGRTN